VAGVARQRREPRTDPPPQGKRDRAPRWAPDGQTLAFLSNRSGSWQVWSIALAGGEAWKRTDLPVDLDGLLWSPDGKWWAATAEVYADCPDLACTKKRDDEREKSGVQARLYDRLMVRHWVAWSEGKRSHVFAIPVEGARRATSRPATRASRPSSAAAPSTTSRLTAASSPLPATPTRTKP